MFENIVTNQIAEQNALADNDQFNPTNVLVVKTKPIIDITSKII